MHAPNDLVLSAAHPLPFKNDKHSRLTVKFKTRTTKCIGKYGLKHGFKTFSFKIKRVDACEGHSKCLHSLSLTPSYTRVYNDHRRHTIGMVHRDLMFCIWLHDCLLVVEPGFFCPVQFCRHVFHHNDLSDSRWAGEKWFEKTIFLSCSK